MWGPSRHLWSLTAANWVSFDFNVAYSSFWSYSLINTLKIKKIRVCRIKRIFSLSFIIPPALGRPCPATAAARLLLLGVWLTMRLVIVFFAVPCTALDATYFWQSRKRPWSCLMLRCRASILRCAILAVTKSGVLPVAWYTCLECTRDDLIQFIL